MSCDNFMKQIFYITLIQIKTLNCQDRESGHEKAECEGQGVGNFCVYWWSFDVDPL